MTSLVIKADGTTEKFALQKLEASLRRAGAPADVAASVAREVEGELREGITTHEIYRSAFKHLREHRRSTAARYSLKQAIQEFGPSGFPFESYLAELFRAEGRDAHTNRIVKGACVEHEVDVIIHEKTNNGQERTTTYVEAKFHNTPGFKTDLKVALYVEARIEDIRRACEGPHESVRGMIVTNTKFTSQATTYAHCRSLAMLGWDEPEGESLHERIGKTRLYPVTALTTLSKREKTALLAERVVLCRSLAMHEDALGRAGVRPRNRQAVLDEAAGLCSG